MQITNKKIINFFSEHKNLDPENVICQFIDIMETLQDSMNNTMNNSAVIDILHNLKSMNMKIDTVSNNITKISSETEANFIVKMNELKKGYMDDLRMILTCNFSDKIEPLLKEHNHALFSHINVIIQKVVPNSEEFVKSNIGFIVDNFQATVTSDTRRLLENKLDVETFRKYITEMDEKLTRTISDTQSVTNKAIVSSETRIDTCMRNIGEISKSTSEKTYALDKSVTNLLSKFQNSSAKGNMSENLIINVIETLYPSAEVTSVGQTKETGDIILSRKDKPRILVENKDWNRAVVQTEVSKFIRDIEIQKCSGIFLSQNGKISTKENYEINVHNENILVYVHDCNNDPNKIKIAVDIIDHLKEKLDEYNDENIGQHNISKEDVGEINAEFQKFIASKLGIIRLSKEFNKNLLKQLDEITMPTLESFLSTKYSVSSSKYTCQFCSYIGKNRQALSAHLRGCKEKKIKDNVTLPEEI
jgi:hypothetical protein